MMYADFDILVSTLDYTIIYTYLLIHCLCYYQFAQADSSYRVFDSCNSLHDCNILKNESNLENDISSTNWFSKKLEEYDDDKDSFSSLSLMIEESLNSSSNACVSMNDSQHTVSDNVLSQFSTVYSQSTQATDPALYEPHSDPDDDENDYWCSQQTTRSDNSSFSDNSFTYSNNDIRFRRLDPLSLTNTDLDDTQPYKSDGGYTQDNSNVSSFAKNITLSTPLRLMNSTPSTQKDEFDFFDPITENDVAELDRLTTIQEKNKITYQN